MKSKLIIVLSLLLILALDGLVLAEKTKGGGAAFSPDGVAVTNIQRRRKRRRRYKAQRPTSYPVMVTPDTGTVAPPEQPASPQPPTAEEMPNAAAPPPPAADPSMDTPGRGAPAKKTAPRIKPPTVNIKPPTR